MNKEQPIDILSSNVSEESVIECAEDRTMGSLDKFKDVGGIASATKTELMQVEGIGEKIADNIMEVLKKEGIK